MLAVPADHYVADREGYLLTLEKGIRVLPGATGVVFGIPPNRPETGYGYIQAHKPDPEADSVPVIRFVEKPDVARARQYVSAGNYYWNSGMFLWRNRTLLDLFREHMPELHRGLETLRPLIGVDSKRAARRRCFASLPRISIDFGVMEKASGLRLVPAEFSWDDIGNWAALDRTLAHDEYYNVAVGPHMALETDHCILYSDSDSVAAFGVSDLIIVKAKGQVLVCAKNRAAELKRLIAMMGDES
jgi:mannose-1-phosphate guanylyltransferase